MMGPTDPYAATDRLDDALIEVIATRLEARGGPAAPVRSAASKHGSTAPRRPPDRAARPFEARRCAPSASG
jgi:hypothetical protein